MKYIEHWRHAHRTKPSVHLNTEGVRTARRLGQSAGPYARVVTSPKKRAAETAVALGFAVDATAPLLKDVPEALNDFVSYDAGFSAFYGAIGKTPHAERFLRKLRAFLEHELEKIPDGGRLLLVSHGGVVEWSALACLPDSARDLGKPIDKCESIVMTWDQGKFTSVSARRHARSTEKS